MTSPNPEQITIAAARRDFAQLTTDQLVPLYMAAEAGWDASGRDGYELVAHLFSGRNDSGNAVPHPLVLQAMSSVVNERLGS